MSQTFGNRSRHTHTHANDSKALARPNKLLPILCCRWICSKTPNIATYRCAVSKLHHIISMLWCRARPPVQLYKPLSCPCSCEHTYIITEEEGEREEAEKPRCVRPNWVLRCRASEHSFDVMILPHFGYITKSRSIYIYIFCLLLNND